MPLCVCTRVCLCVFVCACICICVFLCVCLLIYLLNFTKHQNYRVLDTTIYGYEPHKSRMSSTGWCGSKDAFIFLSVSVLPQIHTILNAHSTYFNLLTLFLFQVDLQRIYTLTTLRLAGVAGSGHLKGHVTRMQLFHKVQFSQNYDNYVQVCLCVCACVCVCLCVFTILPLPCSFIVCFPEYLSKCSENSRKCSTFNDF